MDHVKKTAMAAAFYSRDIHDACLDALEYWGYTSPMEQQEWMHHAQAAFDALMDAVPDLVWELERGCEYVEKAVTQFGTFFIVDDTDDFTGYFVDLVTHKDAKWFGSVTATSIEVVSCVKDDSIKPLKAIANAYHRELVSEIWGGKSDG